MDMIVRGVSGTKTNDNGFRSGRRVALLIRCTWDSQLTTARLLMTANSRYHGGEKERFFMAVNANAHVRRQGGNDDRCCRLFFFSCMLFKTGSLRR
ncbi:hypothetical protein CDAR_232621 [Caerostris darwini]|uniref:Uncharacterized protein n=1 Tax=Caerostris darwini TaxID=1538125 RepID=A0AAV4W838_9ARAC|nr:hypothetical protein CDAR_232621 [Caerostris darwini]